MTKKTKNIVRALKKRFETLYVALENEEDKEEIDIQNIEKNEDIYNIDLENDYDDEEYWED